MTVSICIPTYNQVAFIELAILSAYNQTYKPIEIIVSDDCSTDTTESILKKLQNEIPILRVLSQPKNVGITTNVNACLKEAKGDLIVRLDSDDLLLPNYVERFVPFFIENSRLGYGHCSIQEINELNNNLNKRILFRKQGIQNCNEALIESLLGYKVAANIIIFRKKALEDVGYIQSKIDFAEDYYLTASISSFGYHNLYLKDILAKYRVWVDIKKARTRRKLSEIKGLKAVFDEVITPSFANRNWSNIKVEKAKLRFAISQADCLGWEIFNIEERKNLLLELRGLSNSYIAQIVYFLFFNRVGWVIEFPKRIIREIKGLLKSKIINTN